MRFLAPNLENKGRVLRALGGIILVLAGVLLWPDHKIGAAICLASAVVGLFEASRGWCLLRACGLKTRW